MAARGLGVSAPRPAAFRWPSPLGRRDLFQNRGWYVWNNDGDTATLRGPAGNVRDRCSYSDSSENFDAVDC